MPNENDFLWEGANIGKVWAGEAGAFQLASEGKELQQQLADDATTLKLYTNEIQPENLSTDAFCDHILMPLLTALHELTDDAKATKLPLVNNIKLVIPVNWGGKDPSDQGRHFTPLCLNITFTSRLDLWLADNPKSGQLSAEIKVARKQATDSAKKIFQCSATLVESTQDAYLLKPKNTQAKTSLEAALNHSRCLHHCHLCFVG